MVFESPFNEERGETQSQRRPRATPALLRRHIYRSVRSVPQTQHSCGSRGAGSRSLHPGEGDGQ